MGMIFEGSLTIAKPGSPSSPKEKWQNNSMLVPNRSPTDVFPTKSGESGATLKDQGGVSQDSPPARRCRDMNWMDDLDSFLGSFSSKVRGQSAASYAYEWSWAISSALIDLQQKILYQSPAIPFHLNVHCCSGQILQQNGIEQLSMARFRFFAKKDCHRPWGRFWFMVAIFQYWPAKCVISQLIPLHQRCKKHPMCSTEQGVSFSPRCKRTTCTNLLWYGGFQK